jgi:class 3 adenylate cyclase/pimeloyl-ACP methyl ester carboxylesterase
MTQPEIRYTTVGNDRIAYQVIGQGPRDIIATAGQWGHLDLESENPAVARFHRRLTSFGRLIRFDPRGTGLSDPHPKDGRDVWQHWSEDLSAVMDASGSQSAAIVAWIDAGILALYFAAAFPDRVRALVLMNVAARYSAAPDYPQGGTPEAIDQYLEFTRRHYGTERWAKANSPSLAGDERNLRWFAKLLRAMASPKESAEAFLSQQKLDVRPILPNIRVPTLVMARSANRWVSVAQSRHVAEHIPGARYLTLPGADHMPFGETPDLILDHIEEFLTGVRRGGEPERALVALLFCDIVGSTAHAAEIGDAAWRALLDRYDHVLREQVGLFVGKVVSRAGDGSLSTFENPRRAIECALALRDAWRDLGIENRIGIHFGEVELREDGDVGGISVHIGARIMAAADNGGVLVSRTLRDIVIGSQYEFSDRGTHDLKGVPDRWQLFAVARP